LRDRDRRPGAAGPCARAGARPSTTKLLAERAVTPQIAARFPLAEAAEALRFAEGGGNTGKVVLLP
jgi:NADPH:quinone reductase-like Zn-dependent oxidoreductase